MATNFAFGTALGILGFSKYLTLPKSPSVAEISATRVMLGGISLTFGLRTAGSCTSGHSISGMSQLSIATIVMVASMFRGGVSLTELLK